MQPPLVTKPWTKRARPRRMLADAMARVISIRKTLRQSIGAKSDRDYSRMRADAVKMCGLVERLCQRGQAVPAAEVIDYLDLVELSLIQLEGMLMSLLAARSKHAVG